MKKPFLTRQTIILDLDDTLIDTKKRQYHVIKDFFLKKDIHIKNFEDYKKYRIDNHCSNYEFALQYFVSDIMAEEFKLFFINNIEAIKYLALDELIIDTELFNKMINKYDFILLSLRSSKTNSINQLKDLELMSFFKEIHFLTHSTVVNSKTSILADLKNKYNIKSFVGDMIYDYEAANSNQIKFVGVDTGLFNLEVDSEIFSSINRYFSCINSVQQN